MPKIISSLSTVFLVGIVVGTGLSYALGRLVQSRRPTPRRFGGAIRLRPGMRDRYTELHDAVWESVLQRMSLSNIRNFTIYFHEETSTLFCHYEWIGHWGKGPLTADEEAALLKADLEAIAQDPMTKLWWTECEPCQEPFSQWDSQQTPPSQGGVGDWWAPLVCVTQCGHWPDNYAAELRDPDFVKQNPYGKTTIQPTVGV